MAQFKKGDRVWVTGQKFGSMPGIGEATVEAVRQGGRYYYVRPDHGGHYEYSADDVFDITRGPAAAERFQAQLNTYANGLRKELAETERILAFFTDDSEQEQTA